MLSEYSDTFCLVLIRVISCLDICMVVVKLSEFIVFFQVVKVSDCWGVDIRMF